MGKKILVPLSDQEEQGVNAYKEPNNSYLDRFRSQLSSGIAGFPGQIMEPLRQEGLVPNRLSEEDLAEHIKSQSGFMTGLSPLLNALGMLPTPQEIKKKMPVRQDQYGGPEAIADVVPFFMGGPEKLGAKLATGGIKAAATYGGAKAASEATKTIGEKSGYPKTTDMISTIIGGLLGNIGGAKLAGAITELPSKGLKKSVGIDKEGVLSKKKDILRQEGELVGREKTRNITETERTAKIEKKAKGKVTALEKEKAKSEAIFKDKYLESEEALKKIPANKKVIDVSKYDADLEAIFDDEMIGTSETDRATVSKQLKDITNRFKTGTKKPTLDLLLRAKKNLNKQIFEGNLPPGTKLGLELTRDYLRERINVEGAKHPKFIKPWDKAEANFKVVKQADKSLKDLSKTKLEGTGFTTAERLEKIVDTAKEKRLSLKSKEIALGEKPASQSSQGVKIAKEILKHPTAIGSTTGSLVSHALGFGNWGKIILGVGGAGIGKITREVLAFRELKNNHPIFYNNTWKPAAIKAINGNPASLVEAIPLVDSMLSKKSKKKKKKVLVRM